MRLAILFALACSSAPPQPERATPEGWTQLGSDASETDVHTESSGTDTGPFLQIVDVQVTDRPSLVLAKRFALETNLESTMSVACTSPDVPAEDHRVSSEEPATDHLLDVAGLLAEVWYACTATAVGADGTAVLDFTTQVGPIPFPAPQIEVWTAPGGTISDAYTAFNYFQTGNNTKQRLMVVDPNGRARWYWEVPDEVNEGVELAMAAGFSRVLVTAGGRGLRPRLLSDGADVLWTHPEPSSGGVHHHDTELTPSGDVLGLTSANNHLDGVNWEGFRVETVTPFTGELTFTWDSQNAVNHGELPPRGPDEQRNIYHANAVSWIDDDDGVGVLVSLARKNRIIRIDVATGRIVWSLGQGGDFQLLDAAGVPIHDPASWFYFQHDPELNGDRILVHDNGKHRPGGARYSRALEFVLDTEAMTATLIWEYRQDGWYERVWGDLDRLPNGHVLLARGNGRAGGNTPSAILQIDPATNSVVHGFQFPVADDAFYRAERIGGCELFDNAAYCPTL